MKKLLSLFISVFILASSVSVLSPAAYADDKTSFDEVSALSNYAAELPEKYDPRPLNLSSPVKDQYLNSNCWAHAAMATAEQNLLKQGLVTDPSSLKLSGEQFSYGLFNITNDPLNNTAGDLNWTSKGDNGYNQTGMQNMLIAFHLATWPGLVDLDVDYYQGREMALDYSNAKYKLKNAKFYYTPTIEEMKQAVMEYGAMYAAIPTEGLAWDTVYYYNSDTVVDHAVTIVGWDDSIPISSFSDVPANQPSRNGAWLVKNTWGDYRNDGGYVWVSYDHLVNSCIAFEFMLQDEYDNNYFYDRSCGLSDTGAFFSGDTTNDWTANIFEAQKATDTEAEYLKAVNVALSVDKNIGADCTIRIFTDVDETNPESGKLVHTQTEFFDRGGIYTIELDKAIELKKGQKFSVVSELNAREGGHCFTYLARKYSIKDFLAKEDTAPHQSFVKRDSSEWFDMDKNSVVNGHEGGATARLKAFTVTEPKAVQNYSVTALGGSIRVDNPPGLRFGFSLDKTQFTGNENIEDYGFVYSFTNTDDLTVDTPGVYKKQAANRIDHGDYLTYNLVFTKIPKASFNQQVSARAYVKVDGEYYYSDILVRSFNDVANAVLADDSIDQDVKNKINDLLNGGM